MAVAGLHSVLAFNSPFFGDSRPSTRASALLQMWREIENENLISRSYRSRQPRNGSDRQESENGDDISRHPDESANQGLSGSETEHGDNNSIILEQSSDLGESERERVRQIFREWMNSGSKGHSSCGFHLNNRSGAPRDGDACEGIVTIYQEIGVRRPIRRLCGRQTLLDLLVRAQSERKRELLSLAERRLISEFAHRNRIQALLRGRFLRNEKPVLDERPPSRAATELGLLGQRQTVSDLREGFLSKLDNCASASVNSSESDSTSTVGNNVESVSTCLERINTLSHLDVANRNINVQELEVQATEALDPVLDSEMNGQELLHGVDIDITRANEPLLESENVNNSASYETFKENYESTNISGPVDGHTVSEVNANEIDSEDASIRGEEIQESVIGIEERARQQQNNVLFPEPFDDNVEEQGRMQESNENWPSHDLQEAIDSWLDMPSERIDTFYLADNDNVQSMELRELFSRRRVSSLLRSSFRESLDQVLQSHVERLGRATSDWETDDASSFPELIEQDQGPINSGDQTLALSDGTEGNALARSLNLFAASESIWDEEFQGANWSHHNSNLQFETEWEVINELRIDMARLQQRLNNMQSMLEACMEMQFELQRYVRQEVSAALNRSIFSSEVSGDNRLHDESLWNYIRKGICCLCRNSKIDTLLYRCGHMCTCSKCADDLVRCKGKCPMCQAPAIDAVQAYFIQ